MPPRPELQQLGITYRKIPVASIGSTVYLDTAGIIHALEERFPDSPSLFPKRKDGSKSDTGLAVLLASYWTDRPFFQLCASLLAWDKVRFRFVVCYHTEWLDKVTGSLFKG